MSGELLIDSNYMMCIDGYGTLKKMHVNYLKFLQFKDGSLLPSPRYELDFVIWF